MISRMQMATIKALRDQRLFYRAETNKCALSLLYSLIRAKKSNMIRLSI